jgi:hypothetical protein
MGSTRYSPANGGNCVKLMSDVVSSHHEDHEYAADVTGPEAVVAGGGTATGVTLR